MQTRLTFYLSSLAVGIVLAGAALSLVGGKASAKPMAVEPTALVGVPTVAELGRLAKAVDASPKNETSAERQKRVDRVMQLYKGGALKNGADYFLASKVMSQGTTDEEALVCHDMAVGALSLGDRRAAYLAAIGEDQFLVRIGRAQRFGTQKEAKATSASVDLAPVTPLLGIQNSGTVNTNAPTRFSESAPTLSNGDL